MYVQVEVVGTYENCDNFLSTKIETDTLGISSGDMAANILLLPAPSSDWMHTLIDNPIRPASALSE